MKTNDKTQMTTNGGKIEKLNFPIVLLIMKLKESDIKKNKAASTQKLQKKIAIQCEIKEISCSNKTLNRFSHTFHTVNEAIFI